MTKKRGRQIGLVLGFAAIVILYFTEPSTPEAFEVIRLTYIVSGIAGVVSVILWIRSFFRDAAFDTTFDQGVYTFTGLLFAYSVITGLLEGRLPEPGSVLPN